MFDQARPLRRFSSTFTLFAVLLTALQGHCTKPVESAEPVDRPSLKEDARYLSSDELEGRGVGLDGLKRAGSYVRDQFQAAGLDVQSVSGDAFQKFSIVSGTRPGAGNRVELVSPTGEVIPLEIGKDYEIGAFAGSGSFDSEVMFAGYGIEAPEVRYNDFAGVNVNGRAVMVLRRAPRQASENSPFDPHSGGYRHAELRTKLTQISQREGTIAVFVNDPYTARDLAETIQASITNARQEVVDAATRAVDSGMTAEAQANLTSAVTKLKSVVEASTQQVADPLMPFGYGGPGDGKSRIPAIHLSIAVADKLLAAVQTTIADLETAIDSDLQPRSRAIPGWRIRGSISIEIVRTEVANVIGVLPGAGPLAEETVVVGAHYDHVGRGGEMSMQRGSSEIHNGADDNASGTATLLEVARRLSARGTQLPRRVVFIAFTGEEMGLLGSAHYVKDPVFPLESTVAMLNMDMVGRLNDGELIVYGDATSHFWPAPLASQAERLGLKLNLKPEGFGPSDHSSFYGKKIPVLHFFTGVHPDYHRPTDDWEKLNIVGMTQIASLVEELTVAVATSAERPDYVQVAGQADVSSTGSRPYVGTIPDFGGEGPGYGVSGAAPGSPAAAAGLKGGDRIIAIGEYAVSSLDEFDLSLRRFKPGETVDLKVQRGNEQVVLKVTLAPPR